MEGKKRIFWDAFLLTLVVFLAGLFLGISFESSKVAQINEYYANSEIFLMDILALNNMIGLEKNCNLLADANLKMADKVYEEALLLEKYSDSEKLAQAMDLAHKRYDLLRTFLWIDSINIKNKCNSNFSTVVYIYEYKTKDLVKKATQNVWSKILYELKQNKGDKIVLIPIAGNNDIESLESLKRKFEISNLPVVIINEKNLITKLESVGELERYFE